MAENSGRGGAGEVNARRSDVWSHFVISKDSDGKDIATCKRCRNSLGAETKNGTTHLKRHLGSCARHDGPPAKQQRRPPLPPPNPPGTEPSVSASTNNCTLSEASLPALAYPAQGSSSWPELDQEECAAELARMVAFHGYPSSIVEDECFRSFVRGLNPHFQMPSRAAVEGLSNTLAVDAMKQLMETLAVCSGQISLVTDTVETGQGRALYMACQFIDEEWAFQKRIMQVFRVVRFPPYGHTALLGAEDICLNVPEGVQKKLFVQGPSSKLEEAVRRWGLPRGRLFSVAWGNQLKTCLEHQDFLDNLCHFIQTGEGSFEIPEVLCVSYTSDVLDLVGETFLEALDVRYEQAYLKTVKDLHLSHEKRTQNYSELGLNHVGRYDKRWYTYYCALEVLHKEYSENNEALVEQPSSLNQTQIMELLGRLTPTEMGAEVSNLLKKPSRLKESIFTDLIRTILGAVYRALVTISSPNGPTANLCLKELMKLRAVLQSEAEDATTVVAKAVAYAKHGGFLGDKDADVVLREVQDVLDNHIKETCLFLSLPAVLDPRYKLEYVAAVLNEVCGSEAPSYISRVQDKIDDIFEEHRRKLRNVINGGEGTSSSRVAAGTRTAAMDLDGNSDERETISEWERYLKEGQVGRGDEGQDFDVLVWWKANSSRYPTVASMARDALAMPASDLLSPEQIARIRSMMSSYCLTYPQAQCDD